MTAPESQPQLGGSPRSFDDHFVGPGGCESRSFDRGDHVIRGYFCGQITLLVFFAGDAAEGIICRYGGDLPSMEEMETSASRFVGGGSVTEWIERLQNGWALIPAGRFHDDASFYLRDTDLQ